MKKNFLWGASTSAYQVEGAYNEDGKGLSVQDNILPLKDNCDFKYASNHYHHWKEDIELMAEMGFKSYRFSISWTRIYPNGVGAINQKGIDFYNNLINELLKYNIEPIVTIYHFDLPLELEKQGGWLNRDIIIPAYVNYAKTLFELFGNRVKYWLTINEQNMMILAGHVIGLVDPNNFKLLYQQNHHMLLAQAKTMTLYHKMNLGGKIAPVPNIACVYPASSKPEDIDAAYKASALRNWLCLDASVYGEYNQLVWNWFVKNNYQPEIQKGDMEILKAGKPDFIALNYYASQTVKSPTKSGEINFKNSDQQSSYDVPKMYDAITNDNLESSKFQWPIDARGFVQTCRELNDRYHLPIMITENGLGTYDKFEDGKIHDDYRINYLRKHIELIPQILNEGINLFGYNPWSAIDLVSTHQGIKKRYGFIYIDADDYGNGTYKRYKKDSFYWYKKVIASNGEDLG